MPRISPACLICLVAATSAGDGSRPPAGWLCATMIAGSTFGQCFREDFSRVDRTPVNQAYRHDSDVENFVRPVDRGA